MNQRIKEGEKISNTGSLWTKDEITQVYKLYKELNGIGLNVQNPEIQQLAQLLGRTASSIQEQTLIFKNLDLGSDYSFGNRTKLSRQVWDEHNISSNIEELVNQNNPISDIDEDEDEKAFLNYKDWNSKLVRHFFNETEVGLEIPCLPASTELFKEITDYEYDVEDFILSIRRAIGSFDFFKKFKSLHSNSLPIESGGKTLRREYPDYFGFIIFLIYALTEDEGVNLSVSNVYDRINNFGSNSLENKWSNIDSTISKNIIEPAWNYMEEWSCNYKQGSVGRFRLQNPLNLQRRYVSRIERHALFNSNKFEAVIDFLIDDGYRPGIVLTLVEWIIFFKKHESKAPYLSNILNYISEESPLQSSIVKYLNNYCENHFTSDSISTNSAQYRRPTTPLRLCITLDVFPNRPVKDLYYRAESEYLDFDSLSRVFENNELLESSFSGLSKKIYTNHSLTEGFLSEYNGHRFQTSNEKYFLIKDHSLNEWRETDQICNEQSVIIILQEESTPRLIGESNLPFEKINIESSHYNALKFKNLSVSDFEIIFDFFKPNIRIDGKIELISSFTTNRRRNIFKEFDPLFKYSGSQYSPELIAISRKSRETLCTLSINENTSLYGLPRDFKYEDEFQICTQDRSVKHRFNLRMSKMSDDANNVFAPSLKDHSGKNRRDFHSSESDVLDIPGNFNRTIDVVKFNQWHGKLFNIFKPSEFGMTVKPKKNTKIEMTLGDNLLAFISQSTNIKTNDFPRLIRELDPTVSVGLSKRIMENWRHLGYINFYEHGDTIRVNKTSLYFVKSTYGLKGFLSGYRNTTILNEVLIASDDEGIIVERKTHSSKYPELYPTKVVLFDRDGDLRKYKFIKEQLKFDYLNNIENAYNIKYVVYQLASLYVQRSTTEFRNLIVKAEEYKTDHHRKRIFDTNKLKWIESNVLVKDLNQNTIVRYEGFVDRSVIHVIIIDSRPLILTELNLGIFSILSKDVFRKRKIMLVETYDFLVPLYLGLPFWIERGLILLNAETPTIEIIDGNYFRVYPKIEYDILQVIEAKLEQNILDI